jgi:pSer/pThr/pTyr-binding forkhead associated (FHA) protein
MAVSLRCGNQNVRVPQGRSVLGRTEGCLVRIDTPHVSRRHAEIELGPDGLHIEELNRRIGVDVNGRRIEGRRRLRPGDRIHIDGVEILVEGEPGSTVAPPSAPPADDAPQATTVAGLGFAVHRETVARLLDESDPTGAGDVLSADITALHLLFTRGKRVAIEDLEGTAHCAFAVARATGEARWVEAVLWLYTAARDAMPAALLAALVEIAPAVAPLRADALQAYLDVVREVVAPLAGAGLIEGLESLAPHCR